MLEPVVIFSWYNILSVFLTIVNQLLRVGLYWSPVSTKKLRRMICMRPFPSSERSRTCISISTGELGLSRFDSMPFMSWIVPNVYIDVLKSIVGIIQCVLGVSLGLCHSSLFSGTVCSNCPCSIKFLVQFYT